MNYKIKQNLFFILVLSACAGKNPVNRGSVESQEKKEMPSEPAPDETGKPNFKNSDNKLVEEIE